MFGDCSGERGWVEPISGFSWKSGVDKFGIEALGFVISEGHAIDNDQLATIVKHPRNLANRSVCLVNVVQDCLQQHRRERIAPKRQRTAIPAD